MERFFYRNSIAAFQEETEDAILGKLSRVNLFDLTELQRNAWLYEIQFLKKILAGKQGEIIFEYTIPRLGKRIDAVLLIQGLVFALEFKVGAQTFQRQDAEQVWDYALDLKNFHEASRNLFIVPVLIATATPDSAKAAEFSIYDDHVFEPVLTNSADFPDILNRIVSQYANPMLDLSRWAVSRYMPTPTIIQAASSLYLNHSVEEITRTEASGETLKATSEFIMNIIEHSRQNHEKSICFVTGVPGAGKTLVGLNIAVRQFEKQNLAVYLSGNQPLVDVLSEALARDKKRQEEAKNPDKRYYITEARRDVKSFIQIVHHYRNTTLAKLKQPIQNGILEIDPEKADKHKADGYSEVEHVAIFDEAQRAWTRTQLASWLKRKQNIPDFPMSEPEFLIWSLNLREDWAVIVCLVGGGQEINTGEAGIGEWLRAINTDPFKNWNVFLSNRLPEQEYAANEIYKSTGDESRFKLCENLHLAVSMRSFRTEQLSAFVGYLLNGDVANAHQTFESFRSQYPIVITRSLEKAKGWLRAHTRGTERCGLVVSSQAYRLRPLAIDVRCKPDTVHWFLDDITDIRSSLFLEDAASEFDVQGLELDWTCVVWDGDLRRQKGVWGNYSFVSSKWQNIRAPERKNYQINAYRVLMTRARQGMVLCIPEGNPEDATRLPEFYDGTFQYLKSIGIPELE